MAEACNEVVDLFGHTGVAQHVLEGAVRESSIRETTCEAVGVKLDHLIDAFNSGELYERPECSMALVPSCIAAPSLALVVRLYSPLHVDGRFWASGSGRAVTGDCTASVGVM